eukprot:GEMP01043633.1.p1 GENE.GEMP01043633.1~~GEMP01043633.1.p1  ORF type:complete len:342 (+),score=97.21 GEMP01043633.1:140-1165(+)
MTDSVFVAGVSIAGASVLLVVGCCLRSHFCPRLDLVGRHVLITGGSSGLGKELARVALRHGANVTLLARTSATMQDAKQELERECALGSGAPLTQWVDTVSCDVTAKYDVIARAVHSAIATRGAIDVLVNCAGGAIPGRFDELGVDVAESLMRVNFLSAVHVTRAVLEKCMPQRILFVSSCAGLIGLYGYTAYSASKFALRGFAESLAMELHTRGCRITITFPPEMPTPGFVAAQMLMPEETAIMSSAADRLDAGVVATATWEDVRKGRFFSLHSLSGWALGTVGAGCSPTQHGNVGAVQVLLMGVLRIVALFTLWKFKRVVTKAAAKRANDSLHASVSMK